LARGPISSDFWPFPTSDGNIDYTNIGFKTYYKKLFSIRTLEIGTKERGGEIAPPPLICAPNPQSEANADRSERTVKSNIGFLPSSDAAVDGAEKESASIA
jgi:hypothetical protein